MRQVIRLEKSQACKALVALKLPLRHLYLQSKKLIDRRKPGILIDVNHLIYPFTNVHFQTAGLHTFSRRR